MDAGKRHEQGMCVMLKPLRLGDSLVLCWFVVRPPLCVHVCISEEDTKKKKLK